LYIQIASAEDMRGRMRRLITDWDSSVCPNLL